MKKELIVVTEGHLNLLGGLRKRWNQRGQGKLRERVDNWIVRNWNTPKRKRFVRSTIRELWNKNKPHWLGVHAEFLREAVDDGLVDAEAHKQALSDLKQAFMTSLETQLVKTIDARVQWSFVGNPVWRALLERHDQTLFATLVAAARVSANIVLDEVPLLSLIEETVDDELIDLLSGLDEGEVGIGNLEVVTPPVRRHRPRLTPPAAKGSDAEEGEEAGEETVITLNPAPEDRSSAEVARDSLLASSSRPARSVLEAAREEAATARGEALLTPGHSIPLPKGLGVEG